MPSYMDLYRRWESQQWAVGDLDFTLDRAGLAEGDRPRPQGDAVVAPPVLQRRGARHRDAGALRLGGADARDRDLPVDPDGRRGAAHGVLRPVVARGGRHRRQGPDGAARGDPARHQRGLQHPLLRPPAVDRAAPGQQPERLRRLRRGRDDLPHRRRGHDRADRPALRARVDARASASPTAVSTAASRRSRATSRAT